MKPAYKVIAFFLFFSLACVSSAVAATGGADATSTPIVEANPTSTPETENSGAEPITVIQEVDIPNAFIIYYDISGSNESEMRQQLDSLSPVGFDGYKGDATTHWRINWGWDGYGNSICDLTTANVTYSIDVTMPRWQAPQDASPELITKWNNYMQALAEHEKGHVDNIVANYKSVEDAIKNATCDTAESAAQAALDPIRQYDIDYDAETNHGATQGARFP